MITTEPLTPVLKWAGGKRWQVPLLRPFWEAACQRGQPWLVDLFCGSLAVPLGLQVRKVVANDLNRHLVNFHRHVQRGLRITSREAQEVLVNDKEVYYRNRERFNQLIQQGRDDSREAAVLFYYLNRTGYNGLCRFNRKGLFNVPFGRYKRINYRRSFTPWKRAMAGWRLLAGDYAQVRIPSQAVVYADPPYDVEFTSYCQQDFSWEDQQQLAGYLASLDVPVIAVNQATPRILELYQDLGFSIRLVDGPRYISCTGDRKPAREMLATKGFKL